LYFNNLFPYAYVNERIFFRLLREVLECQKSYNSLLKKTLEDQKDQVALFKSAIEHNIAICINCCKGCRNYIDFDCENGSENNDCDKDLIEWLRNVGIDEHSIKKVRLSKFICIFCCTVCLCVLTFYAVYPMADQQTNYNQNQIFKKNVI
jgi:hypothetical protein